MKTLVLVRHGKSSWAYDLPDDERPLKSRGVSDANLISRKFKENNALPEKFFSSHAKRALSTCEIFVREFGLPKACISIERNLYDFGGMNVMNFLKNVSNEFNYIMIFGHNHAFTSIANSLGSKYIDNLPTSGLVKLNFDCNSWADISNGTTETILIPKAFK